MENKETTFKETTKFLETHGWTKIPLIDYVEEKKLRKHHTARIGKYSFFKLNKSIKEIKEDKTED